MSRMNIEGAEVYDTLLRTGNRLGVNIMTLGADVALGKDAPHIQVLDANGAARNVNLPPSPQKGDFFLILNPAAGAFALTLRDSGAGALSPAVTVAQAKAVIVFWTGTAWKALVGA